MEQNSHTILLVDDEQHILKAMKRLLRNEKYRLLTTSGGHEALELMWKEGIHLIISDLKMPQMNGTELLAQVKALYPETIRIILTGAPNMAAMAELINQGLLYKFFLKPWNDERLKIDIRMALDHFELVRSNKRLNEKVVEQNTVLKAANAQLDELLKEKMKALEVAREIQQKLLPQEIPQLQGWEVAAKTVYCEETGGDYFDFIFRAGRTDQLGIVVGDVTGHGIGAALLMASVRAFIRGLFYQPFNLSEQITQVNKLLAEDTYQTGRFMTLCFLEIEAESNLIKWVRAGHDPAILYNPVTNEFSELKGEGLIMGVDKSYEYEQFQVKIPEPGTVILIGTDGIWEAKNKAGVMFGKERVKDVIRSSSDKSSAEIIDALIRELQNFRKREDFEDDVTLVLIRSNHGMKGRA